MFGLNGPQQAAVAHEGAPPAGLAGAGSGKTGTRAHRVAPLLREGADPARVGLVTFSRRAAQELLARAGRLSDTSAAGRVWGGTFHSVADRVLRLHGRRLGLDPGFSILDSGEVTELFGLIRSDLGLHNAPRRSPRPSTLMDVVHTEGRPEVEDAVPAEAAVVDGGLAGVDRLLAHLWG